MVPSVTADVSFDTQASEKGEIRWGLYGQHYFRAKLGVTATAGYNVDSAGHSAMVPQILHKSGLNSYVFLRPQPLGMGLPSRRCWWESDDGSRVLACRIAYEYSTWGLEVHQQVRQCMAELRAPLDELLCFYGVGNHGGGPTRENLQSIRELDKGPALPGLSLGTPTRHFQSPRHKDVPLDREWRPRPRFGCRGGTV
jgi:alpha-mannosidase